METKLIVKNIPNKFSEQDKIEFLQLFGCQNVTCLNGKLKSCCFVDFPDAESTKQALDVLHQFEILGKKLVVEYAKPIHQTTANEIEAQKVFDRKSFFLDKAGTKDSADKTNLDNENDLSQCGLAPSLGLNHNFPSHLHYKYPEPNVQILTNIANALATVPKFYTMVLNLMNKMHLPPPFAGLTPTPPLPDNKVNMQDASVDTTDLASYCSSEESELESDSENKKHEIYINNPTISQPIRKRKRLRAAASKDQEKLQMNKPVKSDLQTESPFELTTSVKKLEFKLGNSIKDAVEKKAAPPVHYSIFDERGQFGKIEPVAKVVKVDEKIEKHVVMPDVNETISFEIEGQNIAKVEQSTIESEDEEEEEDNADYITAKVLKENKISSEEILNMNQFKNYKGGDKTNRLYVKNIGKQVSTDELLFIFKRFVRNCTEEEKSTLELRHMKEGRMKGQAFVTFPNENIAEKALRQVHGYILQEKPLVIQYGKANKK
ncbi:RNA-binding region-containing protein 3-like isoform X2 [Clytia hemisphaerica]